MNIIRKIKPDFNLNIKIRYALFPLRINHQHVDEEVKRIERMGVKFVYNSDVHNPSSLKESGKFDAVSISPGLQEVHFETSNAWKTAKDNKIVGALGFLDSANTAEAIIAKKFVKDQHIVVIGGSSSVAMDCVITAKSLGAKSIHIVAQEKILE
jgi:NADPH-dependent glutamate synthase beta subunit-like oxidoreductase